MSRLLLVASILCLLLQAAAAQDDQCEMRDEASLMQKDTFLHSAEPKEEENEALNAEASKSKKSLAEVREERKQRRKAQEDAELQAEIEEHNRRAKAMEDQNMGVVRMVDSTNKNFKDAGVIKAPKVKADAGPAAQIASSMQQGADALRAMTGGKLMGF
eukprot:gnl/TRDRNA2_/TRDRNA2_183620_c0_seq1.p2 gnl/TRDRNA2_/TRDRNA2_183620_c0~~gnl/TRDRNA2_/TRDRNA2_183620_c0_seq1.p2  ORF type:complete len:159 (-),score=48.01 gnl/TRDRNA2_/TRDRNA2_183620_c0_seq1:71-547(-)